MIVLIIVLMIVLKKLRWYFRNRGWYSIYMYSLRLLCLGK